MSVDSIVPSGDELARYVDSSDAQTVRVQAEKVLLDPDKPPHSGTAIVTVADYFERARVRM